MRILIASDTFPPDANGAAVFTQNLGRGLAVMGHNVHHVAPSPTGSAYVEEAGQVIVHRLPSWRYPWHPSFHIARQCGLSGRMSDLIESIAPDVVHIQAHFAVGRTAARTAVRVGIPLIATNHFMPENLFPQAPIMIPQGLTAVAKRWAWNDLARVYSRAAIITAPTPHAASLLAECAGLKNVRSISCGVDLSKFADAGRENGPKRTIVFVGRVEAEKYLEELIKALASMHVDANLRIVGRGSQIHHLMALADRLGVAHRIQFLGYVPDDGLVDVLTGASVFCMPGRVELQSIATLEAMACGLPIVAADAGALPHLVSQEVNGLLYPPGDQEAMARALDWVLSNEARRRAMGQASRTIALSHDIRLTINHFDRLYHSVCDSSH